MHSNTKIRWRRWLLALGAAAALGAGAASAAGECWNCLPCGCSTDGGYLMCCDAYSC